MSGANESHPPSSCSAVCVCGSTRINRRSDAGWDCWPGGEERQHEECCLDCGATRLVCDWVEYPDKTGTSYGKWSTPNSVLGRKHPPNTGKDTKTRRGVK